MIAFGGMMQHYLITGKGPVQFITQIPNFKSCAAKASQLPGAKVAAAKFFGNTLAVADAPCSSSPRSPTSSPAPPRPRSSPAPRSLPPSSSATPLPSPTPSADKQSNHAIERLQHVLFWGFV